MKTISPPYRLIEPLFLPSFYTQNLYPLTCPITMIIIWVYVDIYGYSYPKNAYHKNLKRFYLEVVKMVSGWQASPPIDRIKSV